MNYDLTFEEHLRKINESIENGDVSTTFITQNQIQETDNNNESLSLKELRAQFKGTRKGTKLFE